MESAKKNPWWNKSEQTGSHSTERAPVLCLLLRWYVFPLITGTMWQNLPTFFFYIYNFIKIFQYIQVKTNNHSPKPDYLSIQPGVLLY